MAGGLIQEQKSSIGAVEKLLKRSTKDLLASKANLKIDEGIAYTVAYLAMLRAARGINYVRGITQKREVLNGLLGESLAWYNIVQKEKL